MTTPRLLLTPQRSALLAEHDNDLNVLVRVQAPEMPLEQRSKRPPLHIALVLDRSGSMRGQPLEEAKRCAEFVLDGLEPSDRASLVVYEDRVETLVETTDLEDREGFRRAIRSIESRGATDLHGGWLRGAETLKSIAGDDTLSRVILLSDGCANRGLTDPFVVAEQCRALAEMGVTTSTYGLGHHFNEDLMVEMARQGQGNHYYGQTAEDLMDSFREEFALLNAIYGRGLQLELETNDYVDIEVRNAYEKTGPSTWRLPDLAYGAEAWAVVRVRVAKEKIDALSGEDAARLLTARIRYRDLGGMHVASESARLSLPVLPASAFHAIAEDPLVTTRVGELETARLQEAARSAALSGDWGGVDELLREMHRFGADNEWVHGIEKELRRLASRRDRAMFAKEARYTARKLGSRLAARDEARGSLDSSVPDYLRRKLAQGRREGHRGDSR